MKIKIPSASQFNHSNNSLKTAPQNGAVFLYIKKSGDNNDKNT